MILKMKIREWRKLQHKQLSEEWLHISPQLVPDVNSSGWASHRD